MIFQKFSQNKYKRKRENRCHVTLKPLKRGRTNDFVSSRFCDLGRKNRFRSKMREAETIFRINRIRAGAAYGSRLGLFLEGPVISEGVRAFVGLTDRPGDTDGGDRLPPPIASAVAAGGSLPPAPPHRYGSSLLLAELDSCSIFALPPLASDTRERSRIESRSVDGQLARSAGAGSARWER